MANTSQINDLNKIFFFLRKKIIEISYQAKAHHIGSELSCIDILVALYFNIMNINAKTPNDKNRDFFMALGSTEPFGIRHFHFPEFRLPLIKCRWAHDITMEQIQGFGTRYVLLQNPNNLLFEKPAFLNRILLNNEP